MKKVAIFMSDFHLGQGDRMEEFHADKEFSELLCRLSQEHAEDKVDLVLLGDVMDLWTTITDDTEVNAQTPDDVQIYFTDDCGSPRKAGAKALTEELKKVKAVTEQHPTFFEALGLFLAHDHTRRKLWYVPGNHDHSVVKGDIQQKVCESILTARVVAKAGVGKEELKRRIVFENFYDDRDDDVLQVYAEHGNQLTFGGAFKYKHFAEFGEECPGYFELKLVWNRLERRHPELDNVFMGALDPAMWPGLFWWFLVKGHFGAFWTLRKFRTQYEAYDKNEAVTEARKKMPSPLKTVLHFLKTKWFGVTGDEFDDQVIQFFDKDGQGERPIRAKRDANGEVSKDDPQSWLDPLKVKTLILGHSHHSKDVSLPGLDGVKYYNLGSWIYRYENGRGVVEQTWVTISADLGPGGGGIPPSRKVIDRRMFSRKVELEKIASSPVTADGRDLNPVLHEMSDLRVGDVVLFRWNFGATIGRLLRSFQFPELFRVIPEMVLGAFNRYGTFSYWNHVALVYGSPSEKEEAKEYNDPLFLESIPDAGVAVHGPQHYFAHPRDWTVAVLRPKAAWLNDPEDPGKTWDRRVLLRRMAVSGLEAHYDNSVIMRQTLVYAARSMDRRGRSIVAGLVKGAIAGVLVGIGAAVWLLWWGMPIVIAKAPQWWAEAVDLMEQQKWMQLLITFWDRPEWMRPLWYVDSLLPLLLLAAFLLPLAYVFVRYTAWGLVRLIVLAWSLAFAVIGAVAGLLLVPVMADLTENWALLKPAERWAATIVWAAIPIVAFAVTVMYRLDEELVAAWVLASAVAIVWFSWPLTKFAGFMLSLGEGLARLITAPVFWILRKLGVDFLEKPVSGMQSLDKQFICSGLVQYALLRSAEQTPGAKREDVEVYPKWQETLPKHFASAFGQFEWIYLFVKGQLTHKPGESCKAEVSSDPLKEDPLGKNFLDATKVRKLTPSAPWSLRFALLGMLFLALSVLPEFSSPLVPALKTAGLISGLLAVFFARRARLCLALEPTTLRGRALRNWGELLGTTSVLASLSALQALPGNILGWALVAITVWMLIVNPPRRQCLEPEIPAASA